jgi:transcriptional regulator with GAF, ATPase, and Fis domain
MVHPRGQAYLIARSGPQCDDVWVLEPGKTVTIGRHPDNTIVLRDDWCSRWHAELVLEEGGWVLRDLGSRNGTRVNGALITQPYRLLPQDVIRVGQTELVFSDTLTSLPEHARPSMTDLETAPEETNFFSVTARKGQTSLLRDTATLGLDPSLWQERLAELFRLALAMGSAHTRQEIVEHVLNALREGTRADAVAIVGCEGQGRHEVLAYHGPAGPRTFSRYLSKLVLQEGNGVLAQDIASDAELASRRSLGRLGAVSAICAPVWCDGRIVILLHLYSTDRLRPLQPDDLEYVLAVAHQFSVALQNMEERLSLAGQNQALRDVLEMESELIGVSAPIQQIRETVARVAPTNSTVLIRGESGVGKELVARAIHFNSLRRHGPFVCLNCATLAETLLESELFGHERGAFTGATERKIGKFEAAHKGTIFLDEIGELKPGTQAKLLRVLEGHPFERVGGGQSIQVDVRVVAATNRPLEQMVEAGTFRRDLYFRIQVVEIVVPPLRERREDIPVLAEHFVRKFARAVGRRIVGIHPAALRKLMDYYWPGNVRELKNVLERAVVLGRSDQILPDDILLSGIPLSDEEPDYQPTSLEELERQHIAATLRYTGWNKARAAEILGIERSTLDRKLKKYDIKRPV